MINLSRKFEIQLNRESSIISDYYDDTITGRMLFRRTNRGTNPQGKLHCYFKQTEPFGIGSIIKMKDESYVIISDKDADESNAFYSAIAQKTNITIPIRYKNGFIDVPFVIDNENLSVSQGTVFSQLSGDVVIYTGMNNIVKDININSYYELFGNAYNIKNLFINDNILYLYLKQTEKEENNYSLTYSGETNIDMSATPTYQLSYTALKNDSPVSNPSLTYLSSNETVATVDENGLMTLLKEGTVTITAKWTDGDNTTCAVDFTITGQSASYTTAIYASSDTIKVGGSYKSLELKFYDGEGTEITDTVITDLAFEDFTWTCSCDGVDLTNSDLITWYHTSSNAVNVNKIKFANDTSYLTKYLVITCVVNGVTASKSFELTV